MKIADRADAGVSSHVLALRAGEWVEVKSKEEILATLDERGRLDALPFMPEMLQHCGARFRVFKRAHKTCDTVNNTGGRRMKNAVHLEGLRCDGSAHAGCEAACLVFWKEAWLRRASHPNGLVQIRRPSPPDRAPASETRAAGCTEQAVAAATRTVDTQESKDPTYVCQATALPEATRLLPWWDLSQYVEDYASGNVSLLETFADTAYVGYTAMSRFAYRLGLPPERWLRQVDEVVRRVGRRVPFPERRGTLPPGEKPPARAPLNLQPGEIVRVRPYDDILSTLDENNRHRGMYFGIEDAPHCGVSFRVRARVTKLVSEHTGKMIHLKGNNFILEGAWCESRYSRRRRHCPRAIYTFWREDWLERAES